MSSEEITFVFKKLRSGDISVLGILAIERIRPFITLLLLVPTWMGGAYNSSPLFRAYQKHA